MPSCTRAACKRKQNANSNETQGAAYTNIKNQKKTTDNATCQKVETQVDLQMADEQEEVKNLNLSNGNVERMSNKTEIKKERREKAGYGKRDKEQFDSKITGKSDVKRSSNKFVGAHCSIAGGVSNAVLEANGLGAKAFGLFVRNGRTWKLNPMDDAEAERFREACKEHEFSPGVILPHGSYLLNCGSTNPETLQKSRDTLVHELKICEQLGLTLYNFHPGSACGGGTVEGCIKTVAESINLAHRQTKYIKTVVENMACQGQTVGGKLEELRDIIKGVDDKARVGVCLDTCHAFAAGFDISTESGFNELMSQFDKIIGLKYLCALHLNDSKGELGCHLDRHENIGKGRIGKEGFRRIMNDPRVNNLPMILETPVNDYAKEIKMLYTLEER